MHLIKNKKGIGIAAVLGIVTFVLALTTTLFAVTVNQATMIKTNAENLALVANHTHDITSAIKIIEDDPTILDDLIKRTALSNLLNITFIQPSGMDYWTLTNNDSNLFLTSYIQYIPPGSGGFIEFDDFLSNPANFEPGMLGKYAIPENLHISAVTAYYNEYIAYNNFNPIITTSFSDIMNHAAGSYPLIDYRPSNASINATTITRNRILVVNGSLTINGNFNGIAIVRDNVTISGNNRQINGAIYAGGTWLGANQTKYGTSTPTFLFAHSITTGGGGNSTGNNIYTFSNFLTFNSGGNYVGGLFTPIIDDTIRNNPKVTFQSIPQTWLPLDLTDGIPISLIIPFTGSGGSLGDGQLLSTYPRKE